MLKIIFSDLDGTLCESKQNLKEDMLQELGRLSKKYQIAIVSGAELSRMKVQAPLRYATLMCQNGNEVIEGSGILWKNSFSNKEKVMEHIEKVAAKMDVLINDDMVDDRGSQISFSFVGHHAPLELKKKFDPTRKIRADLLTEFPFSGAVIGGTTCLDYIPRTKGENIQRYLELKGIKSSECLYIGDAFMNHGNDATVLGIIPVHQVSGPEACLEFLKSL